MSLNLNGPDHFGFLYGDYDKGDMRFRINLLPPGENDLYGASDKWRVFVNGDQIGEATCQDTAEQYAVGYCNAPK